MSTSTKDFLLIELGTEELPPKALKALSTAFTQEIEASLKEASLIDEASVVTPFAAPRRLAVLISEVAAAQQDQTVERRGPAVQAAFKDGAPTPAAMGFSSSCGVDVEQLERLKTDKGEWLSYTLIEPGQAIDALVQAALDQAIKRLPIPKRMRWGNSTEEFVRPAKWLVALYGDNVLNVGCLGLKADRTSRGHRFHSDGLISHETASEYDQKMLKEGHVMASFDQRQLAISEQIKVLSNSVDGHLADDQALLDEVTGLVEYPRAVLGEFSKSFLEVPQECLVSSMRDHQKYFHILDRAGTLLPFFITVSNIQSKDEQRMVQGNERVLRARLSDAQFFWESDEKTNLSERVEQLEKVLFHAKLGTVLEKTQRVQSLAGRFAAALNGDVAIAERGAYLCKADLISDMVGEFDELQGVMGHYYADREGEPALVGECIEQHYWPKFAGDQLPQSIEAQSVSLADKLDSLVGIYAAGEVPTGDRDPYALRRAALSILRILIEKERALDISDLVDWSADIYEGQAKLKVDAQTRSDIVAFVRGRLTAYYQAQGISTATINAVSACELNNPLDFENRLKAVNAFSLLDEAVDLAAANKRISNILKKQDGVDDTVKPALLVEPAEQQLFATVTDLNTQCAALFDAGDYQAGLFKLAALRGPIDSFFDQVMVMSDDLDQQTNRLALLKQVQSLFLRVADISLLQSQYTYEYHVLECENIFERMLLRHTRIVQHPKEQKRDHPMKPIILDRDGVINMESAEFIKSPEEWQPIKGSLEAIARLSQAGFDVIVVTNQSGIARGLFSADMLSRIHVRMIDYIHQAGGKLSSIVYCPHGPDDDCDCRKPKTGMYTELAQKLGISFNGIYSVGDSLRDLQAAQLAGAVPVLVETGNGKRAAKTIIKDTDLGLNDTPIYANLSAFTDDLLNEKL